MTKTSAANACTRGQHYNNYDDQTLSEVNLKFDELADLDNEQAGQLN